jgi:hypothetical protein
MKKLTPDQTEFIAEIDAAAPRLNKWIEQARRLRLWILERELMACQKGIRDGIDFQCRAFRDDSLTDPEPLFPQGQFPYGTVRPRSASTNADNNANAFSNTLYWCATCGGNREWTHECKPSNKSTY